MNSKITSEEELVKNLKSVINSAPRNVLTTERRIYKDYQELNKSAIPYRNFGYGSFMELISKHSDVFNVSTCNGESVISVRAEQLDRTVSSIRNMIENTRVKPRNRNSGSARVSLPSRSNDNNNGYRNNSNYNRRSHNSALNSKAIPVKKNFNSETKLNGGVVNHKLDSASNRNLTRLVEEAAGNVVYEDDLPNAYIEKFGYQLDFYRFGFPTLRDALSWADREAIVCYVVRDNRRCITKIKDELNKNVLTAEKAKTLITDFLKSVTKSSTGISINLLPDLFSKWSGCEDLDFQTLLNRSGEPHCAEFLRDLNEKEIISTDDSSGHGLIIGPPTPSKEIPQSIPYSKYPVGGPHRVRIVSAESIDSIILALSAVDPHSELSSALDNVKNDPPPLISSCKTGMECLCVVNECAYRVELVTLTCDSSGTLIVTARSIDNIQDGPFDVALPTQFLRYMPPHIRQYPRALMHVGLAWTHLFADATEEEKWLESINSEREYLAFRKLSDDCDGNHLTRVDLIEEGFANSVADILVREGLVTAVSL